MIIFDAKNIEDLDEATEINGVKPLFSNWDEYNIVLEFWNDLHDYLYRASGKENRRHL